jgi:hypothetical protein
MSSPAQKHFPRVKHVRMSVVAVVGDTFSIAKSPKNTRVSDASFEAKSHVFEVTV